MKLKTILITISILALLAVLSFFLVDEKVFAYLFEHRPTICENKWVDAFRQLGKAWVPIWLLLIWLLATRKVKPVLVALIAMPLIFPLVYPAKYLVARPRPEYRIASIEQPEKEHRFVREWSSFPSGDTATAFAVAAALTPYLAQASTTTRFIALPIVHIAAIMIGLLRILAMKHYPSDTLAGAAAGVLAAYLAWLIIEKHPNLRPHLYITKPSRIITLALIIGLPFLASSERINTLTIFIRQYWPLVLAGFVIAAYTHRDTLPQNDSGQESE